MEILGDLAAVLIGISLGIMGGGGSILTVPVLVYLLKLDPVTATAYSLFIVGASSLFGVLPKYHHGEIDTRVALRFGLPSIITVFLTRAILLPAIPAQLFSIGSWQLTKPMLMMLLFALLMIAAALSMLRPWSATAAASRPRQPGSFILYGILTGLVAGMVGAGGGFLIIPVLVLLGRLDMKKAVGTSLLIIAANSLIGFMGDLGHAAINWQLLLTLAVLSVAGVFIGSGLAGKISARKLRLAFGWMVLGLGVFILIKESMVTAPLP